MDFFCGIDMVEIDRIRKALENPRFLSRVFGPAERSWLESRGMPAQSAAGCFCAKEAFAKALGVGVRGFSLREAQLLRNRAGKPYLTFSGRASELVHSRKLHFDVSISHTRELAVAQVVAWRDASYGKEAAICGY